MNKAMHKLASTLPAAYYAMPDFLDVVFGAEIRSGSDKLENCGCLVNVVKNTMGEYLVHIVVQYALGDNPIVATKWKLNTMREVLKFTDSAMRFYYGRTVSRKIASLLIDGIDSLDLDEIPF